MASSRPTAHVQGRLAGFKVRELDETLPERSFSPQCEHPHKQVVGVGAVENLVRGHRSVRAHLTCLPPDQPPANVPGGDTFVAGDKDLHRALTEQTAGRGTGQ